MLPPVPAPHGGRPGIVGNIGREMTTPPDSHAPERPFCCHRLKGSRPLASDPRWGNTRSGRWGARFSCPPRRCLPVRCQTHCRALALLHLPRR
uniref:Uncharacterized protein n=1 Tax=Oryza sativa subsp. japonica TaxID=39947 RepID=Q84Z71_ORYSJ|nr:hypothetical protein [Oryza sativa Japonica Group]